MQVRLVVRIMKTKFTLCIYSLLSSVVNRLHFKYYVYQISLELLKILLRYAQNRLKMR